MNDLLRALGDPTVRDWYLAFCFAVLVLPMIVMSYWYHTRIKRTEGGRRLMARQGTRPNLPDSVSMMRDISSGRYGDSARTMQKTIYKVIGWWIAANVIVFGLLLWADEVNRAS